jgi:hypothetical protein
MDYYRTHSERMANGLLVAWRTSGENNRVYPSEHLLAAEAGLAPYLRRAISIKKRVGAHFEKSLAISYIRLYIKKMAKKAMSFRFERVDVERWQDSAEKARLTLSEWIRRRCNAKLVSMDWPEASGAGSAKGFAVIEK